jgi:hypothetical protein
MIKGVALTTGEVRDGFDRTDGKCVDLAGENSQYQTQQAKQTMEECKGLCEADNTCSAF